MSAAGLLYRVALACCLAAGVAGIPALWRRGPRWDRLGPALGAIAFLATSAAWGARWVEAGHLPIFGTYESAASLAWAVAAVALAWDAWSRFQSRTVPLCAFASAALLAQGLRFDPAIYELTISERSLVVDAHALLAWSAFGMLAANAATALLLLRRGAGEDERAKRWLVRTLELGFVLHSAMIATGALYEFMLFGTAWSFDPIETLAFVAWVSYGALLHLRLLAGWRARRLAGWCLLVFALLVVSYRGLVYFPAWASFHILDIDLRLH